MENRVALTPITTEPSTPVSNVSLTAPGPAAGGVVASAPQEKPSVTDSPQPGDLRLVIEQDPTTGTFVYKTVDRRTGDILQQFPREDVLRFKQAEHYDPGEVFDGLT